MACEGRSDPGETGTATKRRGRPRSSGAERAILLAGGRLLAERGVRMSMEAVAVAARVSKATIYRRWPSKDALILDLVAGTEEPGEPVRPDAQPSASADARSNLVAWVRSAIEAGDSPRGAALRHLVRRAAEDPALAATLRRRILGRHRDRFADIVEQGVRAGEMRRDLDVAVLLDMVNGPVLYRCLLDSSESTTRDPSEQARVIVDMIWPGIRA